MVAPGVTIFIPFFNEEAVAEEVTRESVDYLETLEMDYELLLVDDGSTDGTTELVNSLENELEKVKSVIHEENRGYGNALKTGFDNASLEYVGYMDGDLQFDVNEFDKFLDAIESNDMVIGLREDRKDDFSRIFVSKFFNLIVRNIFDIDYRDIDCGIKLLKHEIVEEIDLSTDRTVDAELIAKAERKNYSIKQIDVNHRKRGKGESEADGFIGVRAELVVTTLKEIYEIKKDLK